VQKVNYLKAEINPICHLLTLLGAHHIFYVSGLRVKERKRNAEEQANGQLVKVN
jgi:hypothetical protein